LSGRAAEAPPGGGPGPVSGARLAGSVPAGRRGFTFVDYLTEGYIALVAALVLVLHRDRIPAWPVLIGAHAAAIAFIQVLVRLFNARPRNRVLAFLRYLYPMLMYGPFYWETGKLNHLLVAGFLDPSFLRLDARLFGVQPGLAFMDRLPYLALSEVFYAAYFSYYLMIAGLALALYLRSRREFFHYVSVTSLVFYVCYLAYILMPVVGPFILFRELPGFPLPASLQPATVPTFPASVQAGIFFRLMEWVYVPFEAPGASFPSSHVAVAIVTVYFSFRYLRPIRWAHFVVMVLLCASTVYCRYHYVVDVAGGALAAAILVPIGNRVYLRFGRPADLAPG